MPLPQVTIPRRPCLLNGIAVIAVSVLPRGVSPHCLCPPRDAPSPYPNAQETFRRPVSASGDTSRRSRCLRSKSLEPEKQHCSGRPANSVAENFKVRCTKRRHGQSTAHHTQRVAGVVCGETSHRFERRHRGCGVELCRSATESADSRPRPRYRCHGIDTAEVEAAGSRPRPWHQCCGV